MNRISVIYQDTSTGVFDPIRIEVSIDGISYNTISDFFPSDNGSGLRIAFTVEDIPGINYVRLMNTSLSSVDNVYATIVGTGF